MKTYAKLLMEGAATIPHFEVVEPRWDEPNTIAIVLSDLVSDGSGLEAQPVERWANFLFCHDSNWTDSHTKIIKNAVIAFDTNNPLSPIPDNELMVWNEDKSFSLTKLQLLET